MRYCGNQYVAMATAPHEGHLPIESSLLLGAAPNIYCRVPARQAGFPKNIVRNVDKPLTEFSPVTEDFVKDLIKKLHKGPTRLT